MLQNGCHALYQILINVLTFFRELSVKEAMWMQQQGETTTTVEKIRHMQDEIQQLK